MEQVFELSVGGAEEAADEVGAVEAAERGGDAGSVGAVIPEEVLALGELLRRAGRGVDLLAGIGVVAGIVDFRRDRHRGGGEVLDLLEMDAEVAGLDGQLGHVDLAASGMRGDEVGDKLLAQVLPGVDAVEDGLELVELLE